MHCVREPLGTVVRSAMVLVGEHLAWPNLVLRKEDICRQRRVAMLEETSVGVAFVHLSFQEFLSGVVVSALFSQLPFHGDAERFRQRFCFNALVLASLGLGRFRDRPSARNALVDAVVADFAEVSWQVG